MSNLWYILNKEQHQQQLQEQLQQQLRQQLELPPSMSDRFTYTTPNPVAMNPSAIPPRDMVPYPGMHPQYPHPDMSYDPNSAAVMPQSENHNNIEWKYHTHRPEADGDSLGRKAGKRKLLIPRELLKMKQMNAALKIGIPPSTFSKRWRESLPDRTWPFRNHRRIEKNIKMLKAMQQKGHDVTDELNKMQQQQEENLSPAVIDVYEDVNEEYLMKVDDKKWTGRQLPPQVPVHMPQQPPHPQILPQNPLQIQAAPLQITAPPQPQLKPAAAAPATSTPTPASTATSAPPATTPAAPSPTPQSTTPAAPAAVAPQATPISTPAPTTTPTPSETPAVATPAPTPTPTPAPTATEVSPPIKAETSPPPATPAAPTPAPAASTTTTSSPSQLAQQHAPPPSAPAPPAPTPSESTPTPVPSEQPQPM